MTNVIIVLCQTRSFEMTRETKNNSSCFTKKDTDKLETMPRSYAIPPEMAW